MKTNASRVLFFNDPLCLILINFILEDHLSQLTCVNGMVVHYIEFCVVEDLHIKFNNHSKSTFDSCITLDIQYYVKFSLKFRFTFTEPKNVVSGLILPCQLHYRLCYQTVCVQSKQVVCRAVLIKICI